MKMKMPVLNLLAIVLLLLLGSNNSHAVPTDLIDNNPGDSTSATSTSSNSLTLRGNTSIDAADYQYVNLDCSAGIVTWGSNAKLWLCDFISNANKPNSNLTPTKCFNRCYCNCQYEVVCAKYLKCDSSEVKGVCTDSHYAGCKCVQGRSFKARDTNNATVGEDGDETGPLADPGPGGIKCFK